MRIEAPILHQGYISSNSQKEKAMTAFINISNHPSSGWSAEQVEAALTSSKGPRASKIVDLPFPHVPPECEDVLPMATAIVEKVVRIEFVTGVLVAGEFSLAHAIVQGLHGFGFRVYTATTERVVTEEKEADGSVRKVSTFRFVRLRRVPCDPPPISMARVAEMDPTF